MFQFPYNTGRIYAPGGQPYNPGETPSGAHQRELARARPVPWPSMVNSILMTPGNPGTAMLPPTPIVINRFAPLLQNTLFVAGFASKSQG